MFKKLKTNNGFILSALIYPLLVLVMAYSTGTFIRAVNHNLDTIIRYDLIESEYAARKGIEYCSAEFLFSAYRPLGTEASGRFLTHTVSDGVQEGGGNEVAIVDHLSSPTTTPPSDPLMFNIVSDASTIWATFASEQEDPESDYSILAEDVTYGMFECADDSEGRSCNRISAFACKAYDMGGHTYILAAGVSNEKIRLLATRFSNVSLFNYLSFFAGNVEIGWQNIDAKGGKIHANGNIRFNEYARIDNVDELSTAGKFYWDFTPFIHSEDWSETTDTYPTQRWPFYTPNDYINTVFAQGEGNYINMPDGHYIGDRRGLYMWNADRVEYELWDPDPATNDPTNPETYMPPIWPWPGIETDLTYVWDDEGVYESNVYQQADLTCTSGCNPYEANVKINETFIPNRFPFYYEDEYKYKERTGETLRMNLTDSEKQMTAWRDFIESKPKDDHGGSGYVTGLDGVLKDSRGGAKNIRPPSIDVNALASNAIINNQGLLIEQIQDEGPDGIDEPQYIKITLNGVVLTGDGNGGETIFPFVPEDVDTADTQITAEEVECTFGGSNVIFEKKAFINHQTGLRDQVIRVDLSVLQQCETAAVYPEGLSSWIPTGGMVVSKALGFEDRDANQSNDAAVSIGLAIKNGARLPAGGPGLTYIVQGDLIIEGHYNYSSDDADWRPSAAIVSDEVYLVSSGFDYPQKLTYPQHHAEYPNERSYDGGDALPAGTGFDKDYNDNFNWFDAHNPDNATQNEKMANFVRDGEDLNSDGIEEYYYNISLIGANSWNPKFLELWNYYEITDDGTGKPDLSTWRTNEAIVTGSFIQLTNEFPPVVRNFRHNDRRCDQSSKYGPDYDIRHTDVAQAIAWTGTGSEYTCRNSTDDSTEISAANLLAPNMEEKKVYEIRYAGGATVPPGDFKGFSQIVFVELPFTEYNWNYHPVDLGGGYCELAENTSICVERVDAGLYMDCPETCYLDGHTCVALDPENVPEGCVASTN